MREKLAQLENTYDDLTRMLADPDVLAVPAKYQETNKALSEISHVVMLYRELKKLEGEREDAEEMLSSLPKDDELYAMALEEREGLIERLAALDKEIQVELVPKDPNDKRNVVLEVRAGTGGDEATLFASELFRMYCRYGPSSGVGRSTSSTFLSPKPAA